MIINLRPIHSIGKFYNKLNSIGKQRAKKLAREAGRMPKIQIEQAVIALEQSTRYSNIL